MSRPESTPRTNAADDEDPEMTAWIQQLASDDPLPGDGDAVPERGAVDEDPGGTRQKPRRGARALRLGRRRRADRSGTDDQLDAASGAPTDAAPVADAANPATDHPADAGTPSDAPPRRANGPRHAAPHDPDATPHDADDATHHPGDPATHPLDGPAVPHDPDASAAPHHGDANAAPHHADDHAPYAPDASNTPHHTDDPAAAGHSDERAAAHRSDDAAAERHPDDSGTGQRASGDGQDTGVPERSGTGHAAPDAGGTASGGDSWTTPEGGGPADPDGTESGPARRDDPRAAPGGERNARTGDAGTAELPSRLTALGEFVRLVAERVPAQRLVPARELLARADERLALSGRHTVVVLAGTTGSGKSRLFNALSGLDLSRVGARRPTTGDPHACIWDPEGTGPLLDWLGVPEGRRTERESVLDGDAQRALHGLVLIDMPDFDSIEESHRTVVDRLVGAADLVLWVVDPQKYADRTVHEHYLSSLAERDAAITVVLNQVDRLPAPDVDRLAADLRRLLAEDGLPAAPLYLASARTGAGVAELRSALADAVAGRRAAAVRIAADLTAVADGLADLTEAVPPSAPDRDRLTELLAERAGVPGLLDAAEQECRRRGRRATGWWFLRPAFGGGNAERIMAQERYDLDWLDDSPAEPSEPAAPARSGEPSEPSESGERAATRSTDPGRRAADTGRRGGPVGVGAALRELLSPATDRLPAPWRASVRTALADRMPVLAGRLGQLPALAARGVRPTWWTVLSVLQWVFGIAAVAGAVWLVASAVTGAVPDPGLAALWLLLGGVLVGVVAWLAAVPLVRSAARTERDRLAVELRSVVGEAAGDCVWVPVESELSAYRSARAALSAVRGQR